MHKSSLNYLRCVGCQSKLELESYKEKEQIIEGLLSCTKCNLTYPIIHGVAVLWNDFAAYLSNRAKLGGELLLSAKTSQIKSIIKSALAKAAKSQDLSIIEKRWATIYQNNKKSKFYYTIQKTLPKASLTLEHGCSVGTMTGFLAGKCNTVFGIDKSFYAILEAKKTDKKNLDYFVADSMEHPFGKTKFDLLLGLNLFELVEPKKLVKILASQIPKHGTLVLSDPYDYERGAKSVKEPLYENTIRKEITKLGLVISNTTKKPSHMQWNLKLHQRASLQYLVDLVIAKKS
ncbi:MAG: methyltransferase domain-containing protein [Thaumarchaeota archaeon]|nr:methyltransferase domain-containing protein [Nitrososphaerota archaeon]